MNPELYAAKVVKGLAVSFLIWITPLLSNGQSAGDFQSPASYIRVDNHPELHLEQFTFSCWIRISPGGEPIYTGITNLNVYPILSRGIYHPDNDISINYLFGVRAEDNALFLGYESYSPETSTFKSHHISGFTHLRENTWYHVAASFDGRDLKLYTNGKLESMLEVFEAPASGFDADLGIACAFNKNSVPTGSFHGKIDALSVFDHALSQAQILNQMNSEEFSATAGLVLGIPFNEGGGTSLTSEGSLPQSYINGSDISWSSGSHFNALIPPLLDAQPILRIGIISDPQYCDCETPDWAEREYRETLNKLPVAIDTLNNRNVDFSITLGDVIDTLFVSYDSILPLYDAFENEHYFILGNHEFAIEDPHKSALTGLLNMPDYYYALERDNWRFLFLDGTELATYTRVLHPELAAEGDSIINSVNGEIHDEYWNGGISNNQQTWMRQQIEDANASDQSVILFCHIPVLPDSSNMNLWNKEALISLINEYDNVIAYINGHHHQGGYDYRNKKHFITNYSMVETADSSSYAILTIKPNSLYIKGYGYNPDRILSYSNNYSSLPTPAINDSVLHYYHDSASFILQPVLPGFSVDSINFYLTGDSGAFDNELFLLRNDSLFLNASPDFLIRRKFSIRLAAIDYLFDSISTRVDFYLDTTVAIRNYLFSDTTLSRGSDYSISLEALFTDFSKFGLEFSCEIADTAVVKSTLSNKTLVLHPQKFGSSEVFLTAHDRYTNSFFRDTFSIRVFDPENIAPTHKNLELLVLPFQDSLKILLDTIFTDENKDLLSYSIHAENSENTHFNLSEENVLSVWVKSGLIISLGITADDFRGGKDSLLLEVKFNTPPARSISLENISLALNGPTYEIRLDTIYYDADHDPLIYSTQIQDQNIASNTLSGDLLSLEPLSPGNTILFLRVFDDYKGILVDSVNITVNTHPDYLRSFPGDLEWAVSPSPANDILRIKVNNASSGSYTFILFNHLGQVGKIEKRQIGPDQTYVELQADKLSAGLYFLNIFSDVDAPRTIRFLISPGF